MGKFLFNPITGQLDQSGGSGLTLGTTSGTAAEGNHTHAAADVTSGVFNNARINFAAPDAIGSTTRNSGAFTTLNATNGTITASAPVLDLSQTWNNAAAEFHLCTLGIGNSTPWTASTAASTLFRIRLASSTVFSVGYTGTCNAAGLNIANGSASINGNLQLSSNVTFNAGVTTGFCDITSSTGAGLRLYNTGNASAANYERGFMRWSSNVLEIGTEAAGTGSGRNVAFFRGGARQFTLIGSGALQLESTGQLSFASRGAVLMSADGVMWLSNNAGTDFNRLAFGGTTSSFPALKRSSTTLQVRLADDSAFAPLISSQIGIGVASPERPLHIQTTDAVGRIDRVGTVGPAFMMIRMATLGSVTSSWLFGPATGVASVANDDFSIIDYGSTTSGTSGTQRLTIAKSDGQLTVNGNLNLSTKDLVTDTTTGTKIGTGTTQKLGFFNATPIVRPAAIADATDAATTQARLNDLLAAMRSLGLIAT